MDTDGTQASSADKPDQDEHVICAEDFLWILNSQENPPPQNPLMREAARRHAELARAQAGARSRSNPR